MMTIWIYFREAQVGDYVYADGSSSDIWQKNKTVVGICFYVNPKDKTQRLCVSAKEMPFDVLNYWGLFPDNWTEGIALADNPGYSAFDVKDLTNKTANMTGSNSLTNTNYLDSNTDDGYMIQPAGTPVAELGWVESDIDFKDINKGDLLPWGLVNTYKIIRHRNIILSDSNIKLSIPQKTDTATEFEHLVSLMQSVSNNNSAKYKEFYYPAASLCHAYEPVVRTEEELHPDFKAGRWFLPSAGELARLIWLFTYNAEHIAVTQGIYAKAISDGIFTKFDKNTSLQYWSSTEYGSLYAWPISTSRGIYAFNTGNKKNIYNARPVCAF